MEEKKLKDVLLKELKYKHGKWVGTFEFVFTLNQIDYVGYVSFSYDRSWMVNALRYPIFLEENIRSALKYEFNVIFVPLSKEIEKLFFVNREINAPRPKISFFKVHPKSTKELIRADFRLHGVDDVFQTVLALADNVWTYTLSSNKNTVSYYKNFRKWEDAVFEEILDEIRKDPKYSLKIVINAKNYKYKEK